MPTTTSVAGTVPSGSAREAVGATDPWTAALVASLPDPQGELAGQAIAARAGLALQPLPSRRLEAWRFTPTSAIGAVPPRLLRSDDHVQPDPAWPAPAAPACRLLLGRHADPRAGEDLPAGVRRLQGDELTAALGPAATEDPGGGDWPALLNASCSERLLALAVSGTVSMPLELVSDAAEAEGVLPLRVLVVLEPDARLELVQVHRAAGTSLTSVVVHARLAEGARLRHGIVARGHDEAVLLGQVDVRQRPGSRYSLASVCGGWGLARIEPTVVQDGGASFTRLRGLQLASGHQVSDTHSRIRFDGPDGELDQLHKAVADGQARSVFNGAVEVPRAAQRTHAAQMSRNLILSERARIDTKPQLEIVADDVTCTHGATVSRLQEEELFYLRSRGIAAEEASRLLLRGFCDEVIDDLPEVARRWQPLAGLIGQEVFSA
jgi:FeS assembly protein SufD